MKKLNKMAFFIRWVIQKESSVDPRKFQHLAVIIIVTGLVVKNNNIVFLGLGYFLLNQLLTYYVDFSRRKVYDNYIASIYRRNHQTPKTTTEHEDDRKV